MGFQFFRSARLALRFFAEVAGSWGSERLWFRPSLGESDLEGSTDRGVCCNGSWSLSIISWIKQYIYANIIYIYTHTVYCIHWFIFPYGTFQYQWHLHSSKSAPISTVANPPFVDNCLIETHVFFISMLVYPRIHDKKHLHLGKPIKTWKIRRDRSRHFWFVGYLPELNIGTLWLWLT